jgi:hypothetical protein
MINNIKNYHIIIKMDLELFGDFLDDSHFEFTSNLLNEYNCYNLLSILRQRNVNTLSFFEKENITGESLGKFIKDYDCFDNIDLAKTNNLKLENLKESLSESTRIKELDLSSNDLENELSNLGYILKNNKSIEILDLNLSNIVDNYDISDTDLNEFSESLKINNTIKNIGLSTIGPEDYYKLNKKFIESIFNGIKDNKSIEFIDLMNNCIDDNDCIIISNSIKDNTHLKKINLCYNDITLDGLLTILNNLKDRPYPIEINLGTIEINQKNLNLENNSNLITLHCSPKFTSELQLNNTQ